tara:strand:+ start:1225 stop:1812 length:588 start_codon:yes stop_codon:yes gene_type:complete
MSDDKEVFEQLDGYIQKIENLLTQDFWDQSFLLKRKKRDIVRSLMLIKGAREDTLDKINNIGKEDVVAKKKMLKEIPANHKVVYILLNIKNGRDIKAWEQALSALPACSFGRPIYQAEDNVKHAITAQGDSLNAGYVAIYVNDDDVIQADEECDSLGQLLIGLKPNAIMSSHIIKFVHYNQEVYLFINKQLVPEG